MLKPLGLTLLFVLIFIPLIAENEKIKKLKNQLTEVEEGLERMEIINLLTSAYYEIDIDSVARYAYISLNYGKVHNNPLIYSNGLHQLGFAEQKRGNFEKAMDYFIRGLKIRDSLKVDEKIASSNLSLGNIHIHIGADYESQNLYDEADQNYHKAHEFYETALKYALDSNDSLLVYDVYTNLGFVCDRLYQYQKAIDNYKLCYEWVPQKLKPNKKSLIKLRILSAQSDSGILNITDLEKEYEVLTNDFKKRGEINNLMYCNGSFATMVWDINLDLAEKYLQEEDSLAEVFGDINYLASSKSSLYELYKERGHFKKALDYHELYSKYTNQVLNSESKSKFDELLIQYETEKTEKELIQETSKKNKLQLALFAALIFTGGLMTFFLQRQRINRLKRNEERDTFYKEVNNLMKNQELASVEAMLEGQDKERRRISTDLHDRLGSTLSAAKMYFEHASSNAFSTNETENKALKLIDKAIEETRHIAQDLVSGVLSKFGIKAALNDLKDTIEGTGKVKVHIEFNVQVERFELDTEINLYRIIQEAFSNALKHSEASQLTVIFGQNNRQIQLDISDNGIGYDVSTVKYGMGITNIKARVSKLKGFIQIDSDKTGTRFKIIFNL